MCFENCLIPKKFLCAFSLRCGSYVVGLYMFCLMMLVTTAVIVQTKAYSNLEYSTKTPENYLFVFSMVASIDSVFLTLVNLWLLWGICKKNATIVVCWMMVTIIGLLHVFITFVLMCIYATNVNEAARVVCLIVAFVAIGIELYAFLIVYAYWLELKKLKSEGTIA
ncbi:uncharacterized protein LOC114364664 [Ostrinia furnacalis]|uniref:uncharacterized protein LOC114364664 n=1 Tax=Ostrinia furnacalis TaxID=93504 RepID=UPI00103AF957|nr:uncharacterized protein LOC114364664 [Ostrinia furnacalis]